MFPKEGASISDDTWPTRVRRTSAFALLVAENAYDVPIATEYWSQMGNHIRGDPLRRVDQRCSGDECGDGVVVHGTVEVAFDRWRSQERVRDIRCPVAGPLQHRDVTAARRLRDVRVLERGLGELAHEAEAGAPDRSPRRASRPFR